MPRTLLQVLIVLIDELQHQLLGQLWQLRIPVAPTGVARQKSNISIPELSLGGPVRSDPATQSSGRGPDVVRHRTAVQAGSHQLRTLIGNLQVTLTRSP